MQGPCGCPRAARTLFSSGDPYFCNSVSCNLELISVNACFQTVLCNSATRCIRHRAPVM